MGASFVQEGMIRGKVVDEEGNPLAGAKITFYNPVTGFKFTMETDKKGKLLKRYLA